MICEPIPSSQNLLTGGLAASYSQSSLTGSVVTGYVFIIQLTSGL